MKYFRKEKTLYKRTDYLATNFSGMLGTVRNDGEKAEIIKRVKNTTGMYHYEKRIMKISLRILQLNSIEIYTD